MPVHHARLGAVFVSMALLATQPAGGWGKTGHRVTGDIAEGYLSPSATAAVERILGSEGLAEASTWSDFMRGSPEVFWRETSRPFHYVTVPVGKIYAEVGPPPEGDAMTALREFRAVLEDPNVDRDAERSALRFIVHIIGDLHQPLHVGNGTDRGGNQYLVTFYGRATNLHRVWDRDLVDSEELSYLEMSAWLKRRITPELAAEWLEPDPEVWIAESAAIRDTIYPGGDREIHAAYIFEHRDTVRQRLMQAGIRIAAYLNELYAPEAAGE